MDDLKTQQFIMTSPQLFPEFYLFVESLCADHGFVPNIAYGTNSHMSYLRNVRGDNEVFLVDGCSSLLDSKSFIFRELSGVKSGVFMVHNSSNESQTVMEFLQYARNFFRSNSYIV